MYYDVKQQHLEYLNTYQHLSFSLQCNAEPVNTFDMTATLWQKKG